MVKMELLNAIQRFKARRQREIPPVLPGVDSEFSELVELYRKIDEKAGKPEFEKMKAIFNARWSRLTEEKRKILVERLLDMRILPEIIGTALNIFDGKIIRLV
ncbi:MAG: hypothetical protein ACOY3K_00865 [Candidatus Omnitrophota bacterium]